MNVFVSYPFADEARWCDVTNFASGLQHELGMLVPGSRVVQLTETSPIVGALERALRERLESTDVFMPILAPSWFDSSYCREEYQFYVRARLAQSCEPLVVPIRWVDFDLSTYAERYEMTHMRQGRWFDWGELRLESMDSAPVRKMFVIIATALAAWKADSQRRSDA